MTYVENPGTRLIKWRLKLKDYEYTFEYNKGKLNRGVEALSENPTNQKSSESEDSEESDSPEEDKKLEYPENLARVLAIHDRSTSVKVLPITRGQASVPVLEKKSDRAARVKASSSSLNPSRKVTSILKRTGSNTESEKSKPAVSRSTSYKPTRSNPVRSTDIREIPPKPRRRLPAISTGDPEDAYTPPIGIKMPNLDESGIATRVSRRRQQNIFRQPAEASSEFSSSDNISSDDENEENSDPPVFRKSHSVLPGLQPPYIPKKETPPPKSAPASAPSNIPWLSPSTDNYMDVYIDGACSYNGSDQSKAGVGVWFGSNHPLIVSRLARGRQTNNAAELEAAIEAAQRAREAGIQKLRINTDSKFVIHSATEWIRKWETNNWKTSDNKPVKNRTEFEKLKSAIDLLDVKSKYTPSHQGIEGNEKADQLAREGIEKELPPIFPENQEKMDAQLTDPHPIIVKVPFSENNSETSDSDSEQDSISTVTPKTIQTDFSKMKEDLQKSFWQFDKSVMKRGVNSSELGTESMLWDHEGMDENVQLSCTYVSEGEEDQELLEELEALDPCEEYDDQAFSERDQKFLQKYAESAQTEPNEKDEIPKEQFPTFPPPEQKSGVTSQI